MSINNVTLVGRITKDPELINTAQGVAKVSFTLAVNRSYKNAQGQREADFINVTIWRKQAELFAQYVRKGSQIGIIGKIQTRNYENNDGQRVYVTEVIADNFQMLDTRQQQDDNNPTQGYGGGQSRQRQQPQQPTRQQQNDFFGGQPMEIADDDLPF